MSHCAHQPTAALGGGSGVGWIFKIKALKTVTSAYQEEQTKLNFQNKSPRWSYDLFSKFKSNFFF